MAMVMYCHASYPLLAQELLRDAAKAQIRRMCAVKKKRVSLNVPSWVIEEWKSRPKNETAQLLMNVNFDKDRYHHMGIYAAFWKAMSCQYEKEKEYKSEKWNALHCIMLCVSFRTNLSRSWRLS